MQNFKNGLTFERYKLYTHGLILMNRFIIQDIIEQILISLNTVSWIFILLLILALMSLIKSSQRIAFPFIHCRQATESQRCCARPLKFPAMEHYWLEINRFLNNQKRTFILIHPNFCGTFCVFCKNISGTTWECIWMLLSEDMTNPRARYDLQVTTTLPNTKWYFFEAYGNNYYLMRCSRCYNRFLYWEAFSFTILQPKLCWSLC